ncbi:MAG: M23 family metallopeptidase [Microcoleaceae cyanobacterium]
MWNHQLLSRRAGLKYIAGAVLTWGLVLKTSRAQALQVQVMPESPQLGDTISVIATLNTQPNQALTVQMENRSYPMFPLGNNRFRALLPTTPLDQPGAKQIRVINGSEVQPLTLQLRNRSFSTQSIWLPPGKDDIIGTDYEFDRMDAFKALVTPRKYWNGPFQRPSSGSVSTTYGIRRYYNGEFAENYYHRGVDYAAGTGSPVYAPAAGQIAVVGRESQGFELHGNTVGIDHGQGVISVLIHLSRIDVQEGDLVRAGQVVGGVGSTGISTGPHLHWGLYVNGQAVDPVPWRYNGID